MISEVAPRSLNRHPEYSLLSEVRIPGRKYPKQVLAMLMIRRLLPLTLRGLRRSYLRRWLNVLPTKVVPVHIMKMRGEVRHSFDHS